MMNDVYYIPFVYLDDIEPYSTRYLVEARAECLEWFSSAHPEARIAVGPLFNLENGVFRAPIVCCFDP